MDGGELSRQRLRPYWRGNKKYNNSLERFANRKNSLCVKYTWVTNFVTFEWGHRLYDFYPIGICDLMLSLSVGVCSFSINELLEQFF